MTIANTAILKRMSIELDNSITYRITVVHYFDFYKTKLFFAYSTEYDNKEINICFKSKDGRMTEKEIFKFEKGGSSSFKFDCILPDKMSPMFCYIDLYSKEKLNFEFWAEEK